MTKMNYGRRGPPRPGSGGMDHAHRREPAERCISPVEREKRKVERAEKTRQAIEQSWQRDFDLMGAQAFANAQRRSELGLPLNPFDKLILARMPNR